jgi:hypothetical protein
VVEEGRMEMEDKSRKEVKDKVRMKMVDDGVEG